MPRTRRHHGAALKAQGAVAACKGEKTLAEGAEQCGGHLTPITAWKRHVRERVADVLGGTTHTGEAPDLQVRHATMGPLAREHDG